MIGFGNGRGSGGGGDAEGGFDAEDGVGGDVGVGGEVEGSVFQGKRGGEFSLCWKFLGGLKGRGESIRDQMIPSLLLKHEMYMCRPIRVSC